MTITDPNEKIMCTECGENEVEAAGEICDHCFYCDADEDDDFDEEAD